MFLLIFIAIFMTGFAYGAYYNRPSSFQVIFNYLYSGFDQKDPTLYVDNDSNLLITLGRKQTKEMSERHGDWKCQINHWEEPWRNFGKIQKLILTPYNKYHNLKWKFMPRVRYHVFNIIRSYQKILAKRNEKW